MKMPRGLRAYAGRIDPYLALPTIALILIGIFTIYSATEFPESARSGMFVRHLAAIPVAFLILAAMLVVPLRALEDLSYALYAAAVLLLVAVPVVGTEVYGAKRWLAVGPVRIQPSEIAKMATAITLARYLAAKRRDPGRIRNLLGGLALVALPALLVLNQPDLGTAGAFAFLALAAMVWAGLPPLHLLVLLSPLIGLLTRGLLVAWIAFVAASLVLLWRGRFAWIVIVLFALLQAGVFAGAPLVWDRLEDYQKARITTFLDPESDPSGAGYQILQSKIAVGSGGIWGKGYLKGTQKALAFLPQQHTDFIFSVLGEEFGFLGASVTILLFLVLILRGFHLALHSRSPFAGLLAICLTAVLLYHIGVNMAMTVGLLPVTGLPLPLVSYGGTFLTSVLAAIGLLLNISAHRYDY